MVIPPRASNSFGFFVVWHNVAVICEFFVADGADSVLFDNLPVQ
jgi:hypothetical protein